MTPMVRAARVPARPWVVGVVAIALAVNLGVSGMLLVDRTQTALRPQAPAASDSAIQGRVQPTAAAPVEAVQALLARRAAAVRQRDVAAFVATVDPQATKAFRAAQRSVAQALRVLPLASWEYEVDGQRTHEIGAAHAARYRGARTWSPEVVLSYRLAGFDVETTTDEIYPTFVERSGRWYLGSESDLADQGLKTQRGPWDFGPLRVKRNAAALVLFHPGTERLAGQVVAEVTRAIPRIDAVWKQPWVRRAVVIIPRTQAELEALVGEEDLEQIAAVATAESTRQADGSTDGPVGDRVLVNPTNFSKLGPLGRRVVLTHELTHVATRVYTTQGVPSWLVEGFADYVGYLGSGVPVKVAASELAEDLEAGKTPRALPGDDDFDANSPALAQAYEQGWLAARLIADKVGPAGLAALYVAIGEQSGKPGADPAVVVSAALRATLKLDLAGFTSAWRRYVRHQLT